MHAKIELEGEMLNIKLLEKALKDERMSHSRIIAGQADGTLIYIDASGHIHIVHGTGPGPGPGETTAAVKRAMSQIVQGVGELVELTRQHA